MKKSLKDLILSGESEFEFLRNTIQLKEQLYSSIYMCDIDAISDIDKFPEQNYFIPDNDKLCYRIDDELSYKIYSKFFLEKGAFLNANKLTNKISSAIKNILILNDEIEDDIDIFEKDETEGYINIIKDKEIKDNTNTIKDKEIENDANTVKDKEIKNDKNTIKDKKIKNDKNIIKDKKIGNEELDLFIFIMKNKKDIFINYACIILMQIIIKQLIKNKKEISDIRLKYTDICFKFGVAFIRFFIEKLQNNTIKNIFFKPNTHEKFYIRLFNKVNKCDLFLKTLMDNENPLINSEENEAIIISLLTIFDIEDAKMRHNLYKMLRKIVQSKVLEKNTTFPLEYPKMLTQYMTVMLRFGALILESFIWYKLFIKKNQRILYSKKKTKTQLVIKFNQEMINFSAIDIAIQRPFLSKNTAKMIFKNPSYLMNKNKNDELFFGKISAFHYLLLQYSSLQRTHNFIRYNPNMSTTIKNSYLENQENLTTRFVIDKDYLYSFLTLLKYHMQEKTKDIVSKLNFEEKIKKHENIFLLYQIPIDIILNFYEKFKTVSYVKEIFKNILNCILNYNLEDSLLIKEYKSKLELLNEDKIINISNIEKLKINSFINELYNKIFSYKIFMKILIKECILYCNFRYFTVDCFIDSRGRCYYNGFYLNPQSYPITKAFVKLYNPTIIKNQQYSNIILPTVKKFIVNKTYKNVLDEYFYNYDIYLKEQYKLKQDYLNNLLTININIEKDIIQKYKNMPNSFELGYEIMNFIKPHIKKIKKLYVVYSMFIRILFFRKDIQNYFELDATASGLQMTAILFQNKKLGLFCNLANNDKIQEDIYDQCSSFLIKNLDMLKNLLYKIFLEIPNREHVEKQILNYYDQYLDKKITITSLMKKIETLLGALENLHEIKNNLENFFKENFWIIFDHKNNDKKILCYLIILRTLKMNKLRIEFKWLDPWIKSRDFCKKAIMTYGYNATAYRRKEEWLSTLLKLNNYERRTDLFFITIICENLFYFITSTRLKPSKWLRELGILMKTHLEKNVVKKELSKFDALHISFENKFLNMKIHCFKEITKRINIKGLEIRTKRLHQLSLKLPKFAKKTFIINDKKIIRLVKEVNYSLIARKFSPNFIHSMDAFIVHIFKEKLLKINHILSLDNIVINHMTNHDNFSFTLEPFLKLILMDCYDIIYRYDYIKTLHKLDFYPEIAKYKNSHCIKNNTDLLPGDFYKNKNNDIYYKPSTLNLIDTLFVK